MLAQLRQNARVKDLLVRSMATQSIARGGKQKWIDFKERVIHKN